jgi:tRNA U34 5-methylaminomethyl-2-thiouridine-forming methyltransferase MnmC
MNFFRFKTNNRLILRRNLISAGWKVEKIPGPPGKREMLRAYKYE